VVENVAPIRELRKVDVLPPADRRSPTREVVDIAASHIVRLNL
jgi:hypothetical protein